MQLHNLLTSSKEKQPAAGKREQQILKPSGGSVAGAGATASSKSATMLNTTQQQQSSAVARQSKKKSRSGNNLNGGGEKLLKEIQAMIISQDINRKNRAKMAKVGGQHAMRFLNDPKLNEHKIIGEKFQRRKFQSLAVDLYKSKLTNNPMRNEIKLLPLSPSAIAASNQQAITATAADKENLPNQMMETSALTQVAVFNSANSAVIMKQQKHRAGGELMATMPSSMQHQQLKQHLLEAGLGGGAQEVLGEMDHLTLPKMGKQGKAERNHTAVSAVPQHSGVIMDSENIINKTFDHIVPSKQHMNQLMPSGVHTKHSYNTQTLSSQYRTQQTAKSFDNMNQNGMTQMPELKNVHNEPLDLSLAQIVQLGKTKQRQIQNRREGKPPFTTDQRRSSSQGATTNLTRKLPVEESEEEGSVVQTDLTLTAMIQAPKRTQTSSQAGQNSSRSNKKRYIFRDADSMQRNRMITAPAFITQNRGSSNAAYETAEAANKMKSFSMSEPSLCMEPAIISQSVMLNKSMAKDNGVVCPIQSIEQVLPRQFVKLFIARQKDLQLSQSIELQLMRFSQLILDQSPQKIVLKEQGFGAFSAKALAKIIRETDKLIYLDLSLNNLNMGLQSLFHGVIDNQSLVALTLKNNSIDGRKFQQQIFDLVFQHRSLTSLNLGNNLTVKNRNRIHNEGLSAILQAVATSRIPSLLQELYLSNCSITTKGLKNFSLIEQNQAHFHLQILDLSHNELGSETPKLIKGVIPTLISLNLSHTKMEVKGAFLLAQYLKFAHKQNKRHVLRMLDLSNNDIGSAGFLKLLSRLKKSTSLATLNLSGNNFGEGQEKFINLEKFLSRNESCTLLQLSGCKLKSTAMAYLGIGLSKNTTLERIILSENELCGRESIHYLVKGLIDNKEGSKLVDIDLQKNRMTSETIEPFVDLFEQNLKIRTLNLRHNVITDEGAQLLAQALVNNEFITKFLCDMNPIRHSILADIEQHTKQNQQKVNDQEVPTMISEILDVKKKTAQSLYDCVLDPMIKDKIQIVMHPSRLKNLRKASARGGSFHRRHVGPVSKQDKELLLRNQFFDSYDVVAITDEIESQLKTLAIDRQQTFEIYQENETMKERMVDEDKAKLQALKNERDQLLDKKREMEFEVIMLEEAGKSVQAREKKRCDDVENHIETLKLKQEKIKDQIKEIYNERGIKDQDHELVRKAFEKEYEKVQRQLNITKIIHDTYVKEIARFHKKQEEEKERRERQLSEERKLREAELAMQRELAQAEEEQQRKKQEAAKRKKAMIGLRASRQQPQQHQQLGISNKNRREWKSVGSSTMNKSVPQTTKDVMGMNSPQKRKRQQQAAGGKDVMGMNSPSKKRGPNALPLRAQRTLQMKKGIESMKVPAAAANQNESKVITSFTTSLQPTSLQPSSKKEGSEQVRTNKTSVQASEKVSDLTGIAMLAASPSNVIHHFQLCPEDQKSCEDNQSLRINDATQQQHPQHQAETDSSKEYEMIETQENEAGNHEDQGSVPSFKQGSCYEADECCSNLRLQDTNLSGCQNTTGATVKVNSVNQSYRNLPARPVLLTANATTKGDQNFHGIEEIIPDKSSAVAKLEMAASQSQGRWSSDIQDETLTLTNSVLGVNKPPQTSSAFVDQNRQ